MAPAPPFTCPRFAGTYALYVVGHVVVLSFLYTSKTCMLYLQPERDPGLQYGVVGPRVKDGSVEAFMWVTLLASWLCFYALVGSRPGFLKEGDCLDRAEEGITASGDGGGVLLEEGQGLTDTGSVVVPSQAGSWASGVGLVPGDGGDVRGAGKEGGESTLAPPPSSTPPASRPCPACYATQLPRSHHCRACDRCVATFDHHCSLLGTCIGERNRARFLLFMAAQVLSQGMVIGIMNSAFVWRSGTTEWVGANLGAIICLVLLWAIQLPVLALLLLHSWCACTNTTTLEIMRGAPTLWYLGGMDVKECDIPFSQGCAGNLRLFCCTLEAWDCMGGRRWKGGGRGDGEEGPSPSTSQGGCCIREQDWKPYPWVPAAFDRNSQDLTQCWENAAFSCC